MGSDFMISTFPYFNITDSHQDRFAELIEGLPKKLTEDFQEYFGLDDEDEFNIADLLEDIVAACSANCRETCSIYAHDNQGRKYELNVTGGMSYGDQPTELMPVFERAGFFESVYDLAVEFAVEYLNSTCRNSDVKAKEVSCSE